MTLSALGWVPRKGSTSHRLDSMVLELFSNFSDSGILGELPSLCLLTGW